ncbi:MAG: response regulator [Bacteroidales bacterium]|nr:response regulator [Bacteroidales bacterium]
MGVTVPVIYFVDDDPSFHRLLALTLEGSFPQMSFFSTGEAFLDRLANGDRPDLVVLDHNLGSMCGSDILLYLRSNHPSLRVILLSAQEDVEIAVNAIKAGAYDYIVKNDKAIHNLRQAIGHLQCVDSGFLSLNL